MTPEDDDSRLLARVARDGDERAFRQLYSRHAAALYGLARRLTAETADAEDALQDCWLRATRMAGSYAGRSAVRTWLSGILVNVIREHQRAERRHDHLALVVDPPARARDPVGHVDVQRVLVRLPAVLRQVLVLHDQEGWTHREIGELFGFPEGTSRSHLFDARRRARRLLAGGDVVAG